MAELVVLYKTPKDAAAFDDYYFKTHVPIAKKMPGLRKYTVSNGEVATRAGRSPVHFVAILTFDSLAAMKAAFASPEGKATAADALKFARGGVEMLMFDTAEV